MPLLFQHEEMENNFESSFFFEIFKALVKSQKIVF